MKSPIKAYTQTDECDLAIPADHLKTIIKQMKQLKFLAISGFLLISSLCCAQEDYAFRVLANKGANEVKTGNTWQPLKTGAQLKTGDELKISENASVVTRAPSRARLSTTSRSA